MRIIGMLIMMMCLIVALVVTLWWTRNTIAAAVIATMAAGLLLLFLIALVWSLASWWTAKTMERGAEIALRAQQVNDNWDARKTAALAQLMKEGIRVGRLESSNSNLPTLPLPSQEVGWLPALSSFNPSTDIVEDGMNKPNKID